MASVRFTDVQARPTEFLDFTSLTLDEFQLLVPPFEAAFHAYSPTSGEPLVAISGLPGLHAAAGRDPQCRPRNPAARN